MEEIWKDIPNYEGYQVSNLGRVRNSKTRIIKSNIPNYKGYLRVVLYKNNKPNRYFVHRLVAEVFIPNPNNLPQVNHKDGIKGNNKAENLEWITNQKNIQHAWEMGLCKKKIGSKNPMAKAVNQYDLDDNFIRSWDCISDFYKENKMPLNCSGISTCCNGKHKSAYGYKWKYKND